MKPIKNLRTALFYCLAFFFPLSSLAINPSREYIATPDSLRLEYQAVKITTADGYELNSWLYAPDPEKDNDTVLILAYGDAGNMSHFVYHAAAFVQQGFTVVTFDYRGFGKSSDFSIQKDYLYHMEFVDDLKTVTAYTEANIPHEKLGVWALSMGSIIASRAAAEKKSPIDFILGEAFITDTRQHLKRLETIKGKKVELPETAACYKKAICRLNVPLLIYAATEDETTTLADAEQLAASAKAPCRIIPYQGSHLRGFQHLSARGFGDRYVAEAITFLNEDGG